MPTTTRKSSKQSVVDPFASRLRRVRKTYRDRGCDALLITNAPDVHYLTGFHGEDSYAVIGRGKPVILSDSRFNEELEEVADRARVVKRSGPMMAAVSELLGSLSFERVAVQSEYASVQLFEAIGKAVGKKRLSAESRVLAESRAIKDASEIKLIKKAIKIQQDALEETLSELVVGETELEISARLERNMKVRGSSEPAFGPIVAAGANAARPHARPGTLKTKHGRVLLIDWGATWRGYRSDMTRTYCVGSWPRKLGNAYDVVREAYLAACDAAGPGVLASDLDSVARGVIRDAGLGEYFTHSLGHGIGLDVHEDPKLYSASTDVLKAGMVITIEPGVYFPGLGGIRIEDDILITERGSKNLCSMPTDRASCTL